MDFALSTRWNAGRHTDGEAMIEEILALGFRHVELGYDLRPDLVPGVRRAIAGGRVHAASVHNFCPVPVGAPAGHPELFDFSALDPRERERAVEHTSRTVRFAAEVGASVVVVHAGRVEMRRMSDRLCAMHEKGRQFTPGYEKAKLKLQVTREKKAPKHVAALYQSIERILPVLSDTRVRLAIENLPTWESLPSELELEELLKHFASPLLGYWHDIGHGQVRENLGLINQERWLERLQPYLAGLHIHDVAPPACDHLMPPHGNIDFARFRGFATLPVARVVEPMPDTPPEAITEAVALLQRAWGDG